MYLYLCYEDTYMDIYDIHGYINMGYVLITNGLQNLHKAKYTFPTQYIVLYA